MEKRELKVSVPRFDKIPWCSEASLINKPLVLSLLKRYPHSSATFLVSSKKDMKLPILFQAPDVLSKAGGNQRDPTLIRNKQLCSTCRAMKMVVEKDGRHGREHPQGTALPLPHQSPAEGP
ncbi:uncharacterized protein C1orf105 homolog [Megaptera novaeangliae]